MFTQPFEDVKHRINAKYYYYYHQLLHSNCSNKSVNASGCIILVLAVDWFALLLGS